jgi:ubiquinone/menaquinone biosynthesis C-methylase UbiE
MAADSSIARLQSSYDRVAGRYAAEFGDELAHKPFDRKMLDWLIERAPPSAPACDLGCGPGQIAAYLHERGASTCGIDLSAEMVACARRCHPGIPFEQGNMLALEVADASFAGIAAFYSIVHIPPALIRQALAEMRRVLTNGGVLLLAFHVGDQVIHKDDWWGEPVSLDFLFHQTAEIKDSLAAAGFELLEAIERDPYPDVEYPSRRGYLFARKPVMRPVVR